jgi:hypothetical protein
MQDKIQGLAKTMLEKANNMQIVNNLLSPQQIACIILMINPGDRRTKEEKLAEINVPMSTYYHWMRNKDFYAEWQLQMANIMQIEEPEVFAVLAKKIKEGDPSAMKLYYEITGKTGRRMEVTGANGGPIEVERVSYVFDMNEPIEEVIEAQVIKADDDE